jgi:hypothetical protein
MEWRVRHRQPKGTATDGALLYITAPTLDPTAAQQGIDIGYHLTNIVRDEPPAEVFNVPLDYVRRWGGPSDPDVIFGP